MCAVVAHFLDKDLCNRSVLIGMRRIRGCHSGENIAEAVLAVLKEMGIESNNLGFFTADNATTNDKAIEFIAAELKPELKDPGMLRVRCLGHIINLLAKAFLFGNDAESFELETSNLREISHLEALLAHWRKQGPLGKLHNTLVFIRKTPQRREAFSDCCKSAKESDVIIKGMLVFRHSLALFC